ncbi:MAG: acyltransferase [Nanoarchaeota archaeon]|nr:acyltransferase [Nanoarchaeota archaeon]
MPQPKLVDYDQGKVSATAIIGDHVSLGKDSRIWHQCIVYGSPERPVHIGENTQIGSQSHIKPGVTIGNKCRLQDGISIPDLVNIGNYVFVGPRVTFTNDQAPSVPKIFNHTYKELETQIKDYVMIGAGANINSGITLGEFSFIGLAAVVLRNVPAFAVVAGSPARIIGDIREDKYKKLFPELISIYTQAPYDKINKATPLHTKE